MGLVLSKLVGALATGGLVADVSYIQFNPLNATCADDGCVQDLFDLVPGDAGKSVVRIAAFVLAGLGATITLFEALCPQTLSRLVTVRRPAGSLVATTTSAI